MPLEPWYAAIMPAPTRLSLVELHHQPLSADRGRDRDSVNQVAHLPAENLLLLQGLISLRLPRKLCNRPELESLIGHLHHAAKVVWPGRTFLHRMINLLEGFWFARSWAPSQQQKSIAYKELFPVVIAAHVWGHWWCRKHVLFHSDNDAVVHIVNSMTSKVPCLMRLLRNLLLVVARIALPFLPNMCLV